MSPDTPEGRDEGSQAAPSRSAWSPVASRSSLTLCALCPVLAVSDTLVNAIGLGVTALLVAPLAAVLFAITRRWLATETELAGALLLFAGVMGCAELLMRAYFVDLYNALGVFLPLLAANIVMLGVLIAPQASRTGAVLNVLATSARIALVLLVLGIARELVGRGSLLHDAGLMFGQWARGFEMNVFRVDMGFLLGMLPPGAFISLGLLIAARNWVEQRRS
ncbi:MAG: Rnf-Nqr domain containing protein [Steroidobacter sp.]